MAFDLNRRAFSWTAALNNTAPPEDATFLKELQGNILKGHGRHHTAHIFIEFKETAGGRELLKRLSAKNTYSFEQFKQTQIKHETGDVGAVFQTIVLSRKGYAALQLEKFAPTDTAFLQGMAGRVPADPAADEWETGISGSHCMILIGASDPKPDAVPCNHVTTGRPGTKRSLKCWQ